MRKLAWIALLFFFATGTLFAQGPAAARKLIEHSMIVTGDVLIEPDGTVAGLEIDRQEALPPEVVALIEGAAPVWRFEPILVDGEPTRARGLMSLRLIANRQDDGNYRIAIQGAHFGKAALGAGERMAAEGTDTVQILTRKQPVYPMPAVQSGARGTVYVVLRIGPDGRVLDAAAEQVNLRTIGTPHQMTQMRNMLAGSAVRAIREWTFQPPTTGELAGRGEWFGRVAVDYTSHGEKDSEYGQWYAYIPGPRARAPWASAEEDADAAPDVMIAGGFQPMGQGLKLLTPLQGS